VGLVEVVGAGGAQGLVELASDDVTCAATGAISSFQQLNVAQTSPTSL